MTVRTGWLRYRGTTEAEWEASTQVFGRRRLLVAEDTGTIKIADGVHTWSDLPESGGGAGQEEIDAAIAALVDSSPAALDTLNELAAALGDDPNFATTILAALADHSAQHEAGGSDPLTSYAPITRTVGTALGTTGTVDLDMAALHGTIQKTTLTGNPTFTTSNRAAGREVTLVLAAGGSSRTLTWPSWIAVGAALPTTLASGKTLVVTVTFTDNTDAAAVATAAAQP